MKKNELKCLNELAKRNLDDDFLVKSVRKIISY